MTGISNPTRPSDAPTRYFAKAPCSTNSSRICQSISSAPWSSGSPKCWQGNRSSPTRSVQYRNEGSPEETAAMRLDECVQFVRLEVQPPSDPDVRQPTVVPPAANRDRRNAEHRCRLLDLDEAGGWRPEKRGG